MHRIYHVILGDLNLRSYQILWDPVRIEGRISSKVSLELSAEKNWAGHKFLQFSAFALVSDKLTSLCAKQLTVTSNHSEDSSLPMGTVSGGWHSGFHLTLPGGLGTLPPWKAKSTSSSSSSSLSLDDIPWMIRIPLPPSVVARTSRAWPLQKNKLKIHNKQRWADITLCELTDWLTVNNLTLILYNHVSSVYLSQVCQFISFP